MRSNQAQASQQLSIFEEVKDVSLPVKPVRIEHDFGVPERRALSAPGIQSRIKQFVRHENEATSTGLDVDVVNTSLSTTERKSVAGPKIERMLNLPAHPVPLFFTTTFSPLQEWEGYVREIGPESISADLVDLTAGPKNITGQAEIPLVELSDADRRKLRIGGIFRWSIGYQRTTSGTKMRVSNIVFRDLPRWTQKDIREAREEAEKLEKYFGPGRSSLDPNVHSETTSTPASGEWVTLTPREREIMASFALTLNPREREVIAHILGASSFDPNAHSETASTPEWVTVIPHERESMASIAPTLNPREREVMAYIIREGELMASIAPTLNQRELEVMGHIRREFIIKLIAAELRLTEEIVRDHRLQIRQKMTAASMARLEALIDRPKPVTKDEPLGIHRPKPRTN